VNDSELILFYDGDHDKNFITIGRAEQKITRLDAADIYTACEVTHKFHSAIATNLRPHTILQR
jgi:hypothetical protein